MVSEYIFYFKKLVVKSFKNENKWVEWIMQWDELSDQDLAMMSQKSQLG